MLSQLRGADLSGFYYRDYSRCLPDYLTKLAKAAYERRNRELSLLTSGEAVNKRQKWARETIWQLIGGQPERTPLNARTVGSLERESYRIEKVVYESRPGVIVTANLYLPKRGGAPHPGVLFQMGHSELGKAYASYQKCCQGLVQLGFVVLAFDPMGQGERIAYPDSTGMNTRLPSVDDEHSVPGKQMLLLGDTASRYQLWDAIRSLDYLASRPEVDPKRLAGTGQSGGGTLTMLLACTDDRLSAAAISSGNTENVACADFNPPGSTDDAEQDLIGSGAVGFDRWDLLYPLAPKPLLVQVSAHDFYGTYSPRYLSNGREEYEKLARVYDLLGKPEHLSWQSTPLPHGLTYELRLDIYNWFARWLIGSEQKIEVELPVAPEKPQTLWVGATGDVAKDFRSLRPIDLIRKSAAQVPKDVALNQVLPVAPPSANIRLRHLASTPFASARVDAVEVNTYEDIWIPAWLFSPAHADTNKPLLITLDDRGRNVEAHEDGAYHGLARSGQYVLAVDVCGIGDARPEVGRGNPAYTIPHDSEEEFSWAALILGRSLLIQRIADILAVTQAAKNDRPLASVPIRLAARGSLCVPAMFAFHAMPEIQSLYLANGLASYQNLLTTEMYSETLANFEWRLFEATDLPQLARESAPRKIVLAGARDAAKKPVAVESIRQLYTSPNVSTLSSPTWPPRS